MFDSTRTVRRYQSRFGWIFVVSLAVLALSITFAIVAGYLFEEPPPPPGQLPKKSGGGGGGDSFFVSLLVSVVSLLTSIASLIGYTLTTVVAWRKERREQQHAELDLEKKRLEVEILKAELNQPKKSES